MAETQELCVYVHREPDGSPFFLSVGRPDEAELPRPEVPGWSEKATQGFLTNVVTLTEKKNTATQAKSVLRKAFSRMGFEILPDKPQPRATPPKKPPGVDRRKRPRDLTEYRWKHEDYGEHVLTMHAFYKSFELDRRPVHDLVRGKRPAYKGWTVHKET